MVEYGIYLRRPGKIKRNLMLAVKGFIPHDWIAVVRGRSNSMVDHPWQIPIPPAPVVWAALGLSTLSTALAYIIYFRVLATAGATNVLLVTFLIPMSAIFLGTVFLGEHLAWRHFVGMGLIGVGLAAIDGRLLKRIRLKYFPPG